VYPPQKEREAATFGYPRVRCIEQRVRKPLAIRDRRRGERRATASRQECRRTNFVPPARKGFGTGKEGI